jgi:hypothetical protein
MLLPLSISSVLLVSQVSITNDYKYYSRYSDCLDSEIVIRQPLQNKPTLEYNTIDSQEYLESLLEKSFYSPIIEELENDAR